MSITGQHTRALLISCTYLMTPYRNVEQFSEASEILGQMRTILPLSGLYGVWKTEEEKQFFSNFQICYCI